MNLDCSYSSIFTVVFQVNNSLAAMKKAGQPYVRAPHVGTSPGPSAGLEERLENAENNPHTYIYNIYIYIYIL